MATYSAAKTTLVTFLKAGYTARTIYADPTDELTAEDELRGWVEIEWAPGEKGPVGGRLGPNLTQYDTPFSFTLKIMIPRGSGPGAEALLWSTTDALEALVLEAQVGDLTIETVKPITYPLEDADTHLQIDLVCRGYLESIK